jgi:hypothetical protein
MNLQIIWRKFGIYSETWWQWRCKRSLLTHWFVTGSQLLTSNKIVDKMKYDLILGSLPIWWDNFITTHGNNDKWLIFAKMGSEELRRKKPKFQNDGSVAMVAIVRSQGNQSIYPRYYKFKPQQTRVTGSINLTIYSPKSKILLQQISHIWWRWTFLTSRRT